MYTFNLHSKPQMSSDVVIDMFNMRPTNSESDDKSLRLDIYKMKA